jgi:hypothetical protein
MRSMRFTMTVPHDILKNTESLESSDQVSVVRHIDRSGFFTRREIPQMVHFLATLKFSANKSVDQNAGGISRLWLRQVSQCWCNASSSWTF